MINFIIEPFKSLFNDESISFDVLLFSFLIILLPVVLITGSALPDIFLSFIALYFLIKSILKKEWIYYKNPIVLFVLIFCFYGILRSIFSEMPLESLTTSGSIFYFRYIFFSLGVWYLLNKNSHLSKCLLNTMVISILFICLDALYQYFNDFNIVGYGKHNKNRLTSFFGDEPVVGRYVAYLSLFTFTLLYNNFYNQKKNNDFFFHFSINM